MATIEELKAEQKRLESELNKVKNQIKQHHLKEEKEKVKKVRQLMDELGLTIEQIKPKARKPRKAKPTPAQSA